MVAGHPTVHYKKVSDGVKKSRIGLKKVILLDEQAKNIAVARGTDGQYRASVERQTDTQSIKHPHRVRRFRWLWQAKQQANEWRRSS